MESPQAGSAEPPARFPRHLLIPMIMGSVLNPINTSIVAVALVPIGTALGAAPAQTAWLVSGLYIATSIGQPLTGRFVDMYGPKRMFMIGALLVAIAGAIGTVAPSLWVLVAARMLLGLGTCAAYPASMTLIRQVADRRGLANPSGVLTALSVTIQTVAVVGPTLGGLLVDLGGWRATLAVNVPLGLATFGLGWWLLPSRRAPADTNAATASRHVGTAPDGDMTPDGGNSPATASASGGLSRIDWWGIACFGIMLTGLLLFLMEPGVRYLWALAAGVVAGALFTWRELRCAAPFVDLRGIARNRPLLLTYLRGLTSATMQYGFIYGFTQWLQQSAGLSPSLVGIVLLPTFGIALVASAVFGRRPHLRANLLVGSVLQLVVAVALFIIQPQVPLWALFALTGLLGIPQGLMNLSNQNVLYLHAPAAEIGAASGLLRTFQYLGAVTASAATGLAFGTSADTHGMHQLAAVMITVAALTLLLVVGDKALRVSGRGRGKQ